MLDQELSVLLYYCARSAAKTSRNRPVHYAALPEIKHVLLVLRMRIHRFTDERRSRPLGHSSWLLTSVFCFVLAAGAPCAAPGTHSTTMPELKRRDILIYPVVFLRLVSFLNLPTYLSMFDVGRSMFDVPFVPLHAASRTPGAIPRDLYRCALRQLPGFTAFVPCSSGGSLSAS